MPLQKLSGVAIFVSLHECGFSEHNLTQGNQLCRVTGKLGLRSTSVNAMTSVCVPLDEKFPF